jgi:hypothetical protein
MSGLAAAALSDQAAAAVRHAAAIVAGRAASPAVRASPSRWLTAQVDVLDRAIACGQASFCPHINGLAPRVAHAAVAVPGVIACGSCRCYLDLLGPDDRGCDRCPAAGPSLSGGTAAAGMILLSFTLCTACLTATGLRAAVGATQAVPYDGGS